MLEQWLDIPGQKPLGFDETHRRNLKYLRGCFRRSCDNVWNDHRNYCRIDKLWVSRNGDWLRRLDYVGPVKAACGDGACPLFATRKR